MFVLCNIRSDNDGIMSFKLNSVRTGSLSPPRVGLNADVDNNNRKMTTTVQDLQSLLRSKDEKIKELQRQLIEKDERLQALRSQLDKYQSVFGLTFKQANGPRKQRAQGISAEPQRYQNLANQEFKKHSKSSRYVYHAYHVSLSVWSTNWLHVRAKYTINVLYYPVLLSY